MPNFKTYFNNYDVLTKEVETPAKITEEKIFEDVVGTSVPSVDSFIAWLSLNEHINPNIRFKKSKKTVSLFKMPTDKKILHLVKALPNIRLLANEFTEKWKK